MNRGPLCEKCYGTYSPVQCIGCTGYLEGTQFIFQGESKRSKIIISENRKEKKKWLK